jgi:hypothetical protein
MMKISKRKMITTISNQLMLMGPQNSKEEKAEN